MYQRNAVGTLRDRLREPRRFIQAVTGPRQVGKTTLVRQALEGIDLPVHFSSADEPGLRASEWLGQQWDAARLLAREAGQGGAVLVLDEIQKVSDWSEGVKRRWDEDTSARRPLRVVLLGSSPLLVQRGLTESLAGRFETLHASHWSFAEMQQAFDWDLDTFLWHGGYPGSASLINEPARWRRYIVDALVETTISRDVLLLTRIDKPALLRRLFELGCRHSGQILSYTKMIGQLQDAGNTTTLAHYLDLLSGVGMLTGLQKFAGRAARQRASSPKLLALNGALISAQSGLSRKVAMADPAYRGQIVESAVGAHLANATMSGEIELFYWRNGNHEVDFVARSGRKVTAIEVKSGRVRGGLPGMTAFSEAFKPARTLLVGDGGIGIEEFLSKPAEAWVS